MIGAESEPSRELGIVTLGPSKTSMSLRGARADPDDSPGRADGFGGAAGAVRPPVTPVYLVSALSG